MTFAVEVPGSMILEQANCKTENMSQQKTSCEKLNGLIDRIKNFSAKVTVEPFVFCYMFPSVLAGFATQTLTLEKACRVNLNYANDTCDHLMRSETDNFQLEENTSHTLVSNAISWNYPLQTALPGILILFIGSWSDRSGNRKAFMVIPTLGKLVSTVGMIMSTLFFYQFSLSETLLIEGLPPAITGGRVAMTMAVYSYITDITSIVERTFRLGIITAIFTLSRPIALTLCGILIDKSGYLPVLVGSCLLYTFGLVYIILRIKNKTIETVSKGDSPKVKVPFFSFKDPVNTIKVAFKKRQGSRRLQIFLILLADVLIVGPVLGEAQLTYFYTRKQFHFTAVDFSLFLAYSVVMGTIGSIITLYVFTKRLKLRDTVIGFIACLSRLAASIMYGLAPNSKVYYIGPVLDMFSSAGAGSLRSMASKLVDVEENGKLSSLISISEALITVVYSPIFDKVYNMNLDSRLPGAFHLISTGLTLAAMGLLFYIFVLQRRDRKAEDLPMSDEPSQETRM